MKLTGTASQIITRLLPLVQEEPEKLFDLTDHKEQRGNKANAYFHRLVGLLAHGSGTRFYEVKNEMILQYGNHEFLRNKEGEIEFDVRPDDDRWKADPIEHYLPTNYGGEICGVRMRVFLKLAGTHTYNTREMYELIQGVRNECLGSDIPLEEVETFEERRLFYDLQNKAEQGDRHPAQGQEGCREA